MTPRETIRATLEFKQTDSVPYHLYPLNSWPQLASRLDRHFGSLSWRKRIVTYMFGAHGVGDHGTVSLGNGLWRSPWGYTYHETLCHLEIPALLKPDLDGYVWPEPESLGDWEGLARSYASQPDAFRLSGMSFGFFERGMRFRGTENLLMDMIDHPQFVHDLFDGYLKIRLRLIDFVCERLPVDAIWDGGDDCDQRGVMMGLDRWREFIGPRTKAIVDHVHAKGLPVFIHQCGNVLPLVDDYLWMGVDALDPIQPEAMDIYELKRRTRGKMMLIGGMGVQRMMPFGDPEAVRAETRRLIREMGAGGGYVIAPAKPLRDPIRTDNAAAFIETILDQG